MVQVSDASLFPVALYFDELREIVSLRDNTMRRENVIHARASEFSDSQFLVQLCLAGELIEKQAIRTREKVIEYLNHNGVDLCSWFRDGRPITITYADMGHCTFRRYTDEQSTEI